MIYVFPNIHLVFKDHSLLASIWINQISALLLQTLKKNYIVNTASI